MSVMLNGSEPRETDADVFVSVPSRRVSQNSGRDVRRQFCANRLRRVATMAAGDGLETVEVQDELLKLLFELAFGQRPTVAQLQMGSAAIGRAINRVMVRMARSERPES